MNDLMITASAVTIETATGEKLSNGAPEDQDLLRTERDNALMRLGRAEEDIVGLEEKIEKLEDQIAELENEIDSMPAASDLTEVGKAVRAKDWETAAEFLWRCGVPGF